MDEIYSKAIQVNAWLGSGDESTEVAVQGVQRLAAAARLALQAKEPGMEQEALRMQCQKVAQEVLCESLSSNLFQRTEKRNSISTRPN